MSYYENVYSARRGLLKKFSGGNQSFSRRKRGKNIYSPKIKLLIKLVKYEAISDPHRNLWDK